MPAVHFMTCICAPVKVVTDDPSAYLLMANGDYLHKISLDGNQVQTPVLVDQFSDNIQDIDYHYRYM